MTLPPCAPLACSADDDGTDQATLVACQVAWYSTPPETRHHLACQLEASEEVPADEPSSYMQMQCSEGYSGRACLVCDTSNASAQFASACMQALPNLTC